MLMLTRRVKEKILIGDHGEISVCILDINGNQVKVGISAPRQVAIAREEVYQKPHQNHVMPKSVFIQAHQDIIAANDNWFLCKEN